MNERARKIWDDKIDCLSFRLTSLWGALVTNPAAIRLRVARNKIY